MPDKSDYDSVIRCV